MITQLSLLLISYVNFKQDVRSRYTVIYKEKLLWYYGLMDAWELRGLR